ncbi:hypothetical protein N7478_006080 [Penicillium angulare]|uniref:uncharacterized protein n=1 Tax=Penicillium angulare TaxID=116970 RepID=UPI00254224B6|nr:uncharacterized protein N7478_006080 [Penicillium angulare]KAJ5280708.1 hypothetical protein N7478_006080 [Penicillium angulare]
MSVQNIENKDELQQRHVVSCFIFSAAKATPQVALFRRSEKVRTYQHQLAAIAGGIEVYESPIKTAWRELEEETTLTHQNLELWRCGKAYSFSDPSVGRRWTIYPFAFRLKARQEGAEEQAIRLNWEHEGWDWYNPIEVLDKQFDGVPHVADSLRHVLFELEFNEQASQALQSCLKELKSDHQSGSHELTSIALKGFRDVLGNLKDDSKWWETARTAAWHIWKNGRESMSAATFNALIAVLDDMDRLTGQDEDRKIWWESALSIVDRHLERRRAMPILIKDSFMFYLRDLLSSTGTQPRESLKILTLSASSTIKDSILDAFAATRIPQLDLRILESRPLYEGATMASSLLTEFQAKFQLSSDRSFKLNVYTDASAAFASTGVDLVLLGADQISSSGWVRNKMGSLPAVLSAKYVSPQTKILILSGIEKVAQPDTASGEETEENSPSELMGSWLSTNAKGVNLLHDARQTFSASDNCTAYVRNVYFEWVPADLIDAYICEEGTLDVAAIHAKAKQIQQQAEQYFG